MSVIAPDAGRSSRGLLSRLFVTRPAGLVVFGLLLVALAPPAYLLQTGGAMTTGYNIHRLQQERTAWIVKNDQLEAEIAKARSLTWVEHEAVTRLGMQPAGAATVVKMDVPPPAPSTAQVRVRESRMPITIPQAEPVQTDQSIIEEIVGTVSSLVVGR